MDNKQSISGYCDECGCEIVRVVEDYSIKNFNGHRLCRPCQSKLKKMGDIAKHNTAATETVKKPTENKIGTDKIITLQGKQYITHAGLLEVAHQIGISRLQTEIVSDQLADTIIVKTKLTMKDGSYYEAYGDANDKNVNSMIQPHKLRMAETRSVNRALRFATNIGMCSIEELGGNDNAPTNN
jgi:hypothetical protein